MLVSPFLRTRHTRVYIAGDCLTETRSTCESCYSGAAIPAENYVSCRPERSARAGILHPQT